VGNGFRAEKNTLFFVYFVRGNEVQANIDSKNITIPVAIDFSLPFGKKLIFAPAK